MDTAQEQIFLGRREDIREMMDAPKCDPRMTDWAQRRASLLLLLLLVDEVHSLREELAR